MDDIKTRILLKIVSHDSQEYSKFGMCVKN